MKIYAFSKPSVTILIVAYVNLTFLTYVFGGLSNFLSKMRLPKINEMPPSGSKTRRYIVYSMCKMARDAKLRIMIENWVSLRVKIPNMKSQKDTKGPMLDKKPMVPSESC